MLFGAYGDAAGYYKDVTVVDEHLRTVIPQHTAAFMQDATGVEQRREAHDAESERDSAPLAPLVPRANRLHCDFKDRALPKFKKIMHFLDVVAQKWIAM